MKNTLLTILFGTLGLGAFAVGGGPVRWKKPGLRPYDAVITPMTVSHSGFFTVHEVRDSVFFEIPDSLLNRDMMVIVRYVQLPFTAGENRKFAGEEASETPINFERGPDSCILIRKKNLLAEADSGNLARAVANSYSDMVMKSLPLVARGNGSSVVDATAMVKAGSILNIPGLLIRANLENLHTRFIHAYPQNVEIGSSFTMLNSTANVNEEYGTNASIVLLSKKPMARRLFDPRVGFFKFDDEGAGIPHFNDGQQKMDYRNYIARWRLEPKDEDIEKWKRGELVEPKKPIVYYIDPATPKQWRKYLIQGINDWQKAFEKAGFKNAIMGKEWPENDSMNIDDARFSFVRYLPSPTANAYGPHISDPRSGEIIQSHIGWYHNVMTLVHDWYMVQTAMVDPRARKAKFDEELMGQLIRFVSSHEVGHTLGLRHNFGSSSKTPVDSLRSRGYLDAHGHTASIMDYARFNYVVQPGDNIPEKDLFPRIGDYDMWAIQWGYKASFASNELEDKKIVGQWAKDSLAANARYWWGDGEPGIFGTIGGMYDSRCLTEDLSDDVVRANTLAIKNLKALWKNLPAWTKDQDSLGFGENLKSMALATLNQWSRYLGHARMQIGGFTKEVRRDDETAPEYGIIDRTKQKEALDFIDRELLTTPTWILDNAILNRIQELQYPDFVTRFQWFELTQLLRGYLFNKLEGQMRQFGPTRGWNPQDYLDAIHKAVFRELISGKPMDLYRRNLQKSYIAIVMTSMRDADSEEKSTESCGFINTEFYRIRREVNAALKMPRSKEDRMHLEMLAMKLNTLPDY